MCISFQKHEVPKVQRLWCIPQSCAGYPINYIGFFMFVSIYQALNVVGPIVVVFRREIPRTIKEQPNDCSSTYPKTL